MSGEFARIERFFRPLAQHPAALQLSDDAACLEVVSGQSLVITKDLLVENVHFLSDDPPQLIGQKALRTNLSDLAAKGAEPLGYFLGLGLPPHLNDSWLEQFCHGLALDQTEFGLHLLGGDMTATPGGLTLSITALGTVPIGGMVKRSGAKAGDLVVVSGTIGDGAYGLMARRNQLPDIANEHRDFLVQRYQCPSPRVSLRPFLQQYATAAADISDGLVADLAHIAKASLLSAEIRVEDVPLSAALQSVSGKRNWAKILSGGDDYELVMAVSPENWAQAQQELLPVPLQVIGKFVEGTPGKVVCLLADGKKLHLARNGYRHFEDG